MGWFGFIRRAVSRRPFPPDSPVEWQRGDIAIARESGPWEIISNDQPTGGPRKGQSCRVMDVRMIRGCQFLLLAGFPQGVYAACCFDRLERREDKATRFDFRKLLEPRTQPKEIERVE